MRASLVLTVRAQLRELSKSVEFCWGRCFGSGLEVAQPARSRRRRAKRTGPTIKLRAARFSRDSILRCPAWAKCDGKVRRNPRRGGAPLGEQH
eukprot:7587757-Alexandrium_andersonii.AAC.1